MSLLRHEIGDEISHRTINLLGSGRRKEAAGRQGSKARSGLW